MQRTPRLRCSSKPGVIGAGPLIRDVRPINNNKRKIMTGGIHEIRVLKKGSNQSDAESLAKDIVEDWFIREVPVWTYGG